MRNNGVPLHALDAPVADYTAAADELIGAGVTRIDRGKLAAVLAGLADGTARSPGEWVLGVRQWQESLRLRQAPTGDVEADEQHRT